MKATPRTCTDRHSVCRLSFSCSCSSGGSASSRPSLHESELTAAGDAIAPIRDRELKSYRRLGGRRFPLFSSFPGGVVELAELRGNTGTIVKLLPIRLDESWLVSGRGAISTCAGERCDFSYSCALAI